MAVTRSRLTVVTSGRGRQSSLRRTAARFDILLGIDAGFWSLSHRRSDAVGRRGMVATSNPDAALAGLRALEAGGNACDAALAAAGVLVVTEPYQCAPGGDLFAIVVRDGEPPVGPERQRTGAGRARRRASRGVRAAQRDRPGLRRRLDRPRGEVLAARPGGGARAGRSRSRGTGFEIQPKAGRHWRACRADLEGDAAAAFAPASPFRSPAIATALEHAVAGTFYTGPVADGDRVGLVARARRISRRTRTTGSSRSSSPTATARCSSCRRTARARSPAGRSRGSSRPTRPPRSRRSPPPTRAATPRSAARRTCAPPTARGWRSRSSSRSTTASARGCSCRASGSCSRTGAPGSCSTPGTRTSSRRPSGRSTRSSRPPCSGRTGAGRRCSA